MDLNSGRVGQALCYWILTERGTVLACSTVKLLTNEERWDPTTSSQIKELEQKLHEKLGPTANDDEVGVEMNRV